MARMLSFFDFWDQGFYLSAIPFEGTDATSLFCRREAEILQENSYQSSRTKFGGPRTPYTLSKNTHAGPSEKGGRGRKSWFSRPLIMANVDTTNYTEPGVQAMNNSLSLA